MGDGCRFQPLIFQGVPILSPPLLIASSTKSMNWVVVSNHGKIPKVKIPSLGNEKTYPTFGKAENSSSKRYLYLKGDICQFSLEYISEFLMKSQKQRRCCFLSLKQTTCCQSHSILIFTSCLSCLSISLIFQTQRSCSGSRSSAKRKKLV